jgi:hypothetical protein
LIDPENDPDVRLRASGGVSDRVFVAAMVGVFIYLMMMLAGCGYLYHITTSSDGTNVTGDFMIGEPHENTTNSTVLQGLSSSDRFDVQSRIENFATDDVD